MSSIDSTSTTRTKVPVKYSKDYFLKLIQPALDVQKNAYCPYSRFHVGCSLIAKKDQSDSEEQIFIGCNFENQSFGLTICAERCAIGNMLSQLGPNCHVKYVVVATPNGCACCGACLQVLSEFVENGDTPVILIQKDPSQEEDYFVKEELTFKELLPKAINIKDIVKS